MNNEYDFEAYPPELFPWLYPELFPDYGLSTDPTPEPMPDIPVLELPDPVPESTPDISTLEPQPTPEPVVPPVEVITVDELVDRITQSGSASEEPGELAEGDSSEALADVPVVDPDPVSLILDQVLGKLVDVVIDLGEIKKDTGKIQENTAAIAETLDHPALTTSFSDYTVTEALLLFLFLSAFIAACARMLRGGLSWLRS